MSVAYLVNRYPAISHTFIRREIQALERHGVFIERFSIRDTRPELIDLADVDEAANTTVLLKPARCFKALLYLLLTRPRHMLRAAIATWRFKRNAGGGLTRHAAYLLEACHLFVRLDRKKVQHLHVHFGTNPCTVAFLCHALGGPPFSFTVHGPEEFDRPLQESLIEKINAAAFVATISSYSRSQLQRWCHYSQWEKLHVVHCGVEQSLLELPGRPLPATNRFVCVARLSEQKGLFTLLRAAKCLSDKRIEFELVIVGDGPLRAELHQMARDLGLSQVQFTGSQKGDEVTSWLDSARCFVLPSYAEGLPVVIMEAFARSRPVISTYIAGIPELVQPGVNGWLVPAGDDEALSRAMESSLKLADAELFRYGEAGRKRVAERHSVDFEAAKLVTLFKAVAKK